MINIPNPYDPQTPARPEYFGGRKHILDVVSERIDYALRDRKSGGVLIYGHRGVGKTSLLKKILSEASRDSGINNTILIYRRLGNETSVTKLYDILNEELYVEIAKRKDKIEKLKDLAKSVGSIKAFEIGIDLNKFDIEFSQYQRWKLSVQHIQNVDYIMLAIDDADFLSTDAIGELKTIVEDAQKTPIILIVSGGVDFESRLVDKYSPVARIFSEATFNIGRFELKETEEVLSKPIAEEKTKWEPDAIKELHDLTTGYPYLVQCLAKVSYIEDTAITKERVKQSIKNAIEVGKSWLSHEMPHASDQDVECFIRISKLGKDVIQSVEMSKAGVSSPYIGRLVKLGILKQISRGRYSIQKSPIIATYEALKRNLEID